MKRMIGMLVLGLGVLSVAGCGGGAPITLSEEPVYLVTGTVTTEDGEPVVPASVVLTPTPRGTPTDAAGAFTLRRVRAGVYGLTVLYLGHRTEEVPLVVPDAGSGTLTLPLKPDRKLGTPLVDSVPPISVRFEIRSGS